MDNLALQFAFELLKLLDALLGGGSLQSLVSARQSGAAVPFESPKLPRLFSSSRASRATRSERRLLFQQRLFPVRLLAMLIGPQLEDATTSYFRSMSASMLAFVDALKRDCQTRLSFSPVYQPVRTVITVMTLMT